MAPPCHTLFLNRGWGCDLFNVIEAKRRDAATLLGLSLKKVWSLLLSSSWELRAAM